MAQSTCHSPTRLARWCPASLHVLGIESQPLLGPFSLPLASVQARLSTSFGSSLCYFQCSQDLVPVCHTTVPFYFVKWRSLVVGIVASTSSVGMFVMTQITEALLSNYGFKNALRGWAMLFFFTTPLACFYDSRFKEEENDILQCSDHSGEQHSKIIRASHLLRNARFIVYLTSISLVFFVVFAPTIFLVRVQYVHTYNSR